MRNGQIAGRLADRYGDRHEVKSNKDLNRYVQQLKAQYLKTAPPLGRVTFDNRLHVTQNALGINATTTRVQGRKLRKSCEIRVASLFKDTAPDFLRMIVVHELAHIRHFDHDRKFYKLCTYMEPDYHQLEFDLRLYLTLQESEGL